MTRRLILATVISLLIWADAQACMRDQLDARAVQWSNLIVEARLTGIDDATATTQPAHSPTQVIYHFQVQSILDGVGAPGDEITLVRFYGKSDHSQECIPFDRSTIGKPMIVALRRADQSTLPKEAKLDDAKNTFVLVYAADAKDFDANDRADLKRVISDTRKSESAAGDKEIAQQVHAAAFAEDETEAAEAEDAIKQMGTKALAQLQKVMSDAPPAGKTRLQRLTEELTPPKVPVERESP